MVMGMVGGLSVIDAYVSGPGIGGDAPVVGVVRVIAGHRGLGDGGHPVADRAEAAGGPVVAGVGQLVLDGDAELAGEVVDLGASAVVGAGSGQEDVGAVFREGDGGVL